MDNDRHIAYLILKEVETGGAWSNLAAAKYIQKEKADSPAFVRELIYGVLRNRTLLDHNIGRFIKKSPGTAEMIWLRMGFYQLAMMDGVKDHAAVSETVELAGRFKKGSEGFINAVLRSFQRSGKTLEYPAETEDDYLSVRYSADRSITDLWKERYGKETAEELLRVSCTAAPLAVRTNAMKISPGQLKERLEALGFDIRNGSGLAGGCLYVRGTGLLDTQLYKEGYFSVQGESSQYAARLLCPKPGSRVIDLCAAPGGKSCAMAEMMDGKGEILAFDIYGHRTQLIEKEAARLGIGIISSAVKDASVFDPGLESSADFVLADVPCSGLGTLRENPEIKLKAVAGYDVQGRILENALRYVKPGGYVLYSTCTIDPSENEEVVKKCDLIDSSALRVSPQGGNKECRVIASRQLFTKENGYDGFYVCLIQKIRNTGV